MPSQGCIPGVNVIAVTLLGAARGSSSKPGLEISSIIKTGEDDESFHSSNPHFLHLDHYGVCFLPDLEALRFWSHPRQSQNDMERQQGVLWKRRDVFTNRWRPRWFILHPNQGILTYYLLNDTVSDRVSSPQLIQQQPRNNSLVVSQTSATRSAHQQQPSTISTSAIGNMAQNMADAATGLVPQIVGGMANTAGDAVTALTSDLTASRDRAASWDTNVSENAMDYDVVPRGTVYLVGCSVTANPQLSKPSQNLYVLTISPPNKQDSQIHLGARSAQVRDLWLEKLAIVCRESSANAAGTRSQGPPPARAPPSVPEPAAITPTTSNIEGHRAGSNTSARSAAAAIPPVAWQTQEDSSLYQNLTDSLRERIQTSLRSNLALIAAGTSSLQDWKPLFEQQPDNPYQVMAHHAKNAAQPMIQSQGVLPNATPQQVLALILDTDRRSDYETSIRESKCLKELNPHTFFNYTCYNTAWPSSPRDFCHLSHWQVVTRKNGTDDQKAIAIFGFSCPEAEELQPVKPGHVRATLHSSFMLLERVALTRGDDFGTRVTMILSFELGDWNPVVGYHFSNVILAQKASLVSVIGDFLERHEPVIDERLLGPITDSPKLITTVIERLRKKREQQRMKSDRTVNSQASGDDLHDRRPSVVIVDRGAQSDESIPPIRRQGLLLFIPLAVARLAVWVSLPYPSILFLASLFVVVRQLVILYLGDVIAVEQTMRQQLASPVTCRFQIDLKGFLRFIANKKEEREELKDVGTAEVYAVHIVACAVARALKSNQQLSMRRVRLPWLLIDVFLKNKNGEDAAAAGEVVSGPATPPPPNDQGVSVTICENDGTPVTLQNVDTSGVQKIADEMAAAIKVRDSVNVRQTNELGQCLVLATPNYEQVDMEMDVVPKHPNVCVVAVIGGVRLVQSKQRRSPSSPKRGLLSGGHDNLRPVLAFSLTISGPADFVSCQRFAEEVQKLLRFPEMCDVS